MHLRPCRAPTSSVLLALTHVLVDEGLVDRQYVGERTTGLEDVRALGRAGGGPSGPRPCAGVPADALRATARLLAAAAPVHGGRGAYVLTGRGVEQSTQGTATASRPPINLALALGLPGRVGSGYGAAHRSGQRPGRPRARPEEPTSCPGYRMIDDPAARAHVAAVWGVDPRRPARPGRAGRASCCARLGHRRRPAGPAGARLQPRWSSAPNVSARARAARPARPARRLRLRAVRDRPARRRRAARDPVGRGGGHHDHRSRAGSSGAARRIDRARRGALRAVGLAELARRWARRTSAPTPPRCSTSWPAPRAGGRADYSGRSPRPARRDGEALFWPCPATAERRRTRARPGCSSTASRPPTGGRASSPSTTRAGRRRARRDAPCTWSPAGCSSTTSPARRPAGSPSSSRPCPGRCSSCTRCSRHRLGVTDGIACASPPPAAALVATAPVTDAIRPDTVFLPFHWAGELSVNRLTNDATDPVSGMPEFKVCAVRLDAGRPVARSTSQEVSRMRRVVVVGHGMVGSRFVEELVAADPARRRDGARRGAAAAYNRVLLSSVVAGSKTPRACSASPRPPHPRVSVLTGRRRGGSTASRGRWCVDDRRQRARLRRAGARDRVRGPRPPDPGLSPTTKASSTGVFVLKDMDDATGIVAAAERGAPRRRARRRRAGRRGRDRAGPPRAWRCAWCTSPTG